MEKMLVTKQNWSQGMLSSKHLHVVIVAALKIQASEQNLEANYLNKDYKEI